MTRPATEAPAPAPMVDALATWLTVRERVAWPSPPPAVPGRSPHPGNLAVDGARAWITSVRVPQDRAGADRMLAALDRVYADRARPLTFALLASWQAIVLGVAGVGFRTGPAYAKRGRERYGLTATTPADFARCLGQATAPGPPTAVRAARAYLDVSFFHPFPDGNGRAALLTCVSILDRDGIRLADVSGIAVPRWADDAVGAADLARLIAVLIRATERRRLAGS